jgi:hypothetical protein
MKKIISIFMISLCTIPFAFGQNNALGLRFTGGTEVSYQRELSSYNRLEFDLGWTWNTSALSGFYQWDYHITNGLKWYIGPGASLGIYSKDNHSGADIGVGGIVGMEYNFDIPLQVSLDWRPIINFGTYDSQFGSTNVGLSVRYRF